MKLKNTVANINLIKSNDNNRPYLIAFNFQTCTRFVRQTYSKKLECAVLPYLIGSYFSKLQRDLNHKKKYLPNDYMVPPLPATSKNIFIPENTSRKRKKKSRIPTFKHKSLNIKAKDCLDKSKLTIEAMEKSVINIYGKL